jgi:predicted ATP-grasp superfamily ATP-dependent carboligase
MYRTLILDANQRSALAATRSLGARGVEVIAADEMPGALAAVSSVCRASFTYPSPYREPDAFLRCLREECARREIGVLMPMTDVTTDLILRERASFGEVRIPCGEHAVFTALSDKFALFRRAADLGIPIPRTTFVPAGADLTDVLPRLSFPQAVKPQRSRIWRAGEALTTAVAYVRSAEELRALLGRHAYLREYPYLLQERVQGRGQGVFALYERGRPRVFFAHARLREKPPSGGVSVLCESVAVEPGMRDIVESLLAGSGWHGVVMVEFKTSDDGTPYLIEINARFWGSLQLAVDCGVDFPYLSYQLATGVELSINDDYPLGRRSRWLLGDLDNLIITIRDRDNTVPDKIRAVSRFLVPSRRTRFDVNRWRDPRPFLAELRRYVLRQ